MEILRAYGEEEPTAVQLVPHDRESLARTASADLVTGICTQNVGRGIGDENSRFPFSNWENCK
jgi:hypothetical protein